VNRGDAEMEPLANGSATCYSSGRKGLAVVYAKGKISSEQPETNLRQFAVRLDFTG
jgi:hypothetical protein